MLFTKWLCEKRKSVEVTICITNVNLVRKNGFGWMAKKACNLDPDIMVLREQ